MGVTASTIQRYEAGTIDNTKKLVLDGLRVFGVEPHYAPISLRAFTVWVISRRNMISSYSRSISNSRSFEKSDSEISIS